MEDNDRLKLTLGLPCSGSLAIPQHIKDDRDNKLIEDFKFFLEGGIQIPGNNYFNTLSSGTFDMNGYKNPFDDIRSNVGVKHQSQFDDIACNANLHEKMCVFISTDDDDDETDSEAKVSMCRVAPQNGFLKEVHRLYGDPFGPNIMNIPYLLPRDSNPINAAGMFGYTPVQVLISDKDANPQNSDKTNDAHKTSPAMQSEGTALDQANDSGLICQREDSGKGVADGLNQQREERQSIKPGIGGDVEFGGSGSYPNLPWVNTTGPGPNGRTISGVVYRYSGTQLRIVCACHGFHLSPQEFIQHASPGGPPTGSRSGSGFGSGLASIPGSNSAGLAQS